MVILRLQINRYFNVSCTAQVRDTWIQLCTMLILYKNLFASHQEVILIEDQCGIETSNRPPTAWCQPLLFFQQTTEENSHCRVRHPTKSPLLSCWKICSLALLPFCFFPPELFTICRLSATCAVFNCVHSLWEEKYVGSELILVLTYREIPVVFNLDCGIQELYWEEKRMYFEQKMCTGSSLLFCCWNLGQHREKWQAHNLVWQPYHSVLGACQFSLAK